MFSSCDRNCVRSWVRAGKSGESLSCQRVGETQRSVHAGKKLRVQREARRRQPAYQRHSKWSRTPFSAPLINPARGPRFPAFVTLSNSPKKFLVPHYPSIATSLYEGVAGARTNLKWRAL